MHGFNKQPAGYGIAGPPNPTLQANRIAQTTNPIFEITEILSQACKV